MPQTPEFHVLIPAAGSGTRVGGDIPKQFLKIGRKTVLRHTLEKFLSLDGVKSVQVIIDPEWVNAYHEAVHDLDLPDPIHGGQTRKQSVYNGLHQLLKVKDEEILLVHDAARPMISQGHIVEVVKAAGRDGAATLAAAIHDTIVQDEGYTQLDRARLRSIQTPQGFQAGLLRKAHSQFKDNENFTDDAGMVAALGHKVTLVDGDRLNFKITTAEDMIRAAKLLSAPIETRTGLGFDIHRFSGAPAAEIRLGGVDVAHPLSIDAHSDGDVILHALTDALLGTIGDGDIGQLFPPSDPQWRSADSHLFVAEALARVKKRGGRVIHADISVQAETPKLGPYRGKITENIAKILEISPERVGLKATTMEKLGDIGAGLGLAAQVIVSVEFSV